MTRKADRKPRRDAGSTADGVGILVAGMHRSGTSALTRLLNLMGCDLPGNLIAGRPNDNELGFWESRPVVELNKEILESAGSVWDDWVSFNPDWYRSPVASGYRERVRQVLDEEFGKSRFFAIKDPRICRLMPFWREALTAHGTQPAVVMPLRSPLEVAASLNKRNHSAVADSHITWLRHVLDAELGSRGLPRVVVRYDALLKDWRRQVDRIARALDITWPRRPDSVAASVEDFLSPDLRHNVDGDEAARDRTACPAWVAETYEILCRWAQDDVKPSDRKRLDEIRDAFDHASPAFAEIVGQARESSRQAYLYSQQVEKLNGVQAAFEAAQKSASEAAETHEKTRTDFQWVKKKLEEERAAHARTRTEFETLQHRLAETQSALAQRRTEADEVTRLLNEAQAELNDAKAELSAAKAGKEAAEKAASQAGALANDLKQHIKLLEMDLKEERSLRDRAEKSLSQIAHERAETAALVDAKNQELAQKSIAVEEVEMQVEAKSKELRQMSAAVQEAKARAETKDKELAQMSTVIREAEKRAAEHGKIAESTLLSAVKAVVRYQSSVPMHMRGRAWQLAFLPLKARNLKHSGLFDADWYLEQNPDVAKSGFDPAKHYLLHGLYEGRAPNRRFDKG